MRNSIAVITGAAALLVTGGRAGAQESTRLRLRFDTLQASAVIRTLDDPDTTGSWGSHVRDALGTEAFRRLQAREGAMRRPLTDSAFMDFLRSDTLRQRRASLRRTLDAWSTADLQGAGRRALQYLPAQAQISATVYVVIKPRTNSFVWEARTDPAVFLYLEPTMSADRFANTVAHELHHIGYSSIAAITDSLVAELPERSRAVAEWVSAFGEGFAMLAAAGGPEVHPHASSAPEERQRWDRDLAHFNADVRQVDDFLLGVLSNRYHTPDSTRQVGMTFFGVQGAWYTVGWRMAAMIERSLGRPELIRCMLDPHRLLATYNRLALQQNRAHADSLAQWSEALLSALAPPRGGG